MAREQERDQQLFEALDPDTARVLFPERFAGQVEVTLVYPPLQGDAAAEAETLAAAAAGHTAVNDPTRPGNPEVHRTSFTLGELEELHSLYSLLERHADPGDVEILIDGAALPLVRELWLPLLWSLRA